MSQTVSMFSVPYDGKRLYAIVPQPMLPAFDRLTMDDPIWRQGADGGVRHEQTWEIDSGRYRLRLRDQLKAWIA